MRLPVERLQRISRTAFRGLWRNPVFMKLWVSSTITSFGAQITNLALPLTAAVLLQATPWQMGVLVALETLPFALVSLHAGVLIDRVRKLPIVILADIGRGAALLAIPITAWTGTLSVEILYVVGFLCGVQNVVGGAAYQVLLAQLAGRGRLVEVNAKIALGETSAALVGPGLAGGLIQLVTAPFTIVSGRSSSSTSSEVRGTTSVLPSESGPGWLTSGASAIVTVRLPLVIAPRLMRTPSPITMTPVRSLTTTRAKAAGAISCLRSDEMNETVDSLGKSPGTRTAIVIGSWATAIDG